MAGGRCRAGRRELIAAVGEGGCRTVGAHRHGDVRGHRGGHAQRLAGEEGSRSWALATRRPPDGGARTDGVADREDVGVEEGGIGTVLGAEGV